MKINIGTSCGNIVGVETNKEIYKERDWYKDLSKEDQITFDQKFSQVVSEGLDGEILFFIEGELKNGVSPIEALLDGMEDWDIL